MDRHKRFIPEDLPEDADEPADAAAVSPTLRPSRRGMPGLTMRALSTLPHPGAPTRTERAEPARRAHRQRHEACLAGRRAHGRAPRAHRGRCFRQGGQLGGGAPDGRPRVPPYKLVMHLQALIAAMHEKPAGEAQRHEAVTQSDEESTWKLQRNNSLRMQSQGFETMADVHDSIMREQEEMLNITQWSREAEASAVSRVEVQKVQLAAEEESLEKKKADYDVFRMEKINELSRIAAELQERDNALTSEKQKLEGRKIRIEQLRKELQKKYGPESAVSGGFVPSVEDLKLLASDLRENTQFAASQGLASPAKKDSANKRVEPPPPRGRRSLRRSRRCPG